MCSDACPCLLVDYNKGKFDRISNTKLADFGENGRFNLAGSGKKLVTDTTNATGDAVNSYAQCYDTFVNT